MRMPPSQRQAAAKKLSINKRFLLRILTGYVEDS